MTERRASRPTPERITFAEWFIRGEHNPLPAEKPLLIETNVSFSPLQATIFTREAERQMLELPTATVAAIRLLKNIDSNMNPGDELYINADNGYERYNFFAPQEDMDKRAFMRCLLEERETTTLKHHTNRYNITIDGSFSHAIDAFNNLHKGLIIAKTDGRIIPIP